MKPKVLSMSINRKEPTMNNDLATKVAHLEHLLLDLIDRTPVGVQRDSPAGIRQREADAAAEAAAARRAAELARTDAVAAQVAEALARLDLLDRLAQGPCCGHLRGAAQAWAVLQHYDTAAPQPYADPAGRTMWLREHPGAQADGCCEACCAIRYHVHERPSRSFPRFSDKEHAPQILADVRAALVAQTADA